MDFPDQVLSVKGTDESMTRVDSWVPLMYHDPDRSWNTDPDPDHPKECTQSFCIIDLGFDDQLDPTKENCADGHYWDQQVD